MTLLRSLLRRHPVVHTAALFLPRAARAVSYVMQPAKYILPWLITSHETTNYTYDLTPMNKHYLAALLAAITGVSTSTILGYFGELEQDEELQRHIRTLTQTSSERGIADPVGKYGRRLGWYALARVQKPAVIIETGVDKGLGSCVLAAALLRNAEEGHPGRYYGTDISPRAGYLFAGRYATVGRILYGDSIASLQAFSEKVDLFINDSDHSHSYEAQEYRAIEGKLQPQAYILGDNAHVSEVLFQFAQQTGREFVFFRETPAKHWYPGAGIGIAFRRP